MPVNLPPLRRLGALRAVCRAGGFSAAARELFLTQSAVSTQIRILEDEVGARLVERVGKTARPTPAGEILLAATEGALATLEGALQRIADMRGEITGEFVVGAGGVASTYLLPPLLSRFADRHPRARVRLRTGHARDFVLGLADGTLDMMVTTAPLVDARLESGHFFDDRQVCILPPGDPFARAAVRPRDLAGRRLVLYERHAQVRENVDAWLEAGLRPGAGRRDRPEIVDVGISEAEKSFVMAGFGWAIISAVAVEREARDGRLRALPLEPRLSRELITLWRRDRAGNPAIRAMRAVIDEWRGEGRGRAAE